MSKAISFMPTMSWEEHCEFTGRFRDRIAQGSFAPADEDHDKLPAKGRRGKSRRAKAKA